MKKLIITLMLCCGFISLPVLGGIAENPVALLYTQKCTPSSNNTDGTVTCSCPNNRNNGTNCKYFNSLVTYYETKTWKFCTSGTDPNDVNKFFGLDGYSQEPFECSVSYPSSPGEMPNGLNCRTQDTPLFKLLNNKLESWARGATVDKPGLCGFYPKNGRYHVQIRNPD